MQADKLLLEVLSQCDVKGRPSYKGEMPLSYCPFHEHNFRSPSFSVNVNKKTYFCFSCGATGHLGKLFYHYGLDTVDLYNDIKHPGDFEVKISEMLKDFGVEEKDKNNSDIGELKNYRFLHPYLIDRGFTKDILLHNRVGFNRENCRVTVPVFYNKKYYGVIQRTAADDTPKYLYPDNFQKSAVVYSPKPITLVRDDICIWNEGSLDALKGAQYGYESKAILGCQFSNIQLKSFESSSKTQILMLDNDPAGIAGTKDVLQRTNRFDVYVAVYPEGKKDPGELTKEEYDETILNAVHRFLWLDSLD